MDERFPHKVESYKGIEIWYNPVKKLYVASHCEHTVRYESIKAVKKWIDEYKS
jgi:hypothetical protein